MNRLRIKNYSVKDEKNLRKFFQKTPFRFGYQTNWGIGYGNGYNTLLLRDIFINFKNKKIEYEYSPALSLSSYGEESFNSWNDLKKKLPKTINDFDEKIKR